MFAIITKYKGPTDHHGSRIVVSCDGKRMSVPWDYTLNPADNHVAAALAFAEKHKGSRMSVEVVSAYRSASGAECVHVAVFS
jgi:hypothetical protein